MLRRNFAMPLALIGFALFAASGAHSGSKFASLEQLRTYAQEVDRKWKMLSHDELAKLQKDMAPVINAVTAKKESDYEYLHAIQFQGPEIGWALDWNGRLHRTADGGLTWNTARIVDPWLVKLLDPNEGPFRDMGFADADFGLIVGPAGIFQTEDSGRTWKHLRSAPSKTAFTAVYCAVDRVCWAAGSEPHVMYKREDPGSAWIRYNTPTDSPITEIQFVNEMTGFATGLQGDVIGTSDGGRHWTVLLHNPQREFRALHFINENSGWVVGSDGAIVHTANGGNTWVEQKPNLPPEFPTNELRFDAVKFADAQRGWAAGRYGIVFGTVDAGEHWILQRYQGLGFQASQFSIYALAVTEGPTIWAVGNGGNIFVSIDRGAYWFPVSGPFARVLDELRRRLLGEGG